MTARNDRVAMRRPGRAVKIMEPACEKDRYLLVRVFLLARLDGSARSHRRAQISVRMEKKTGMIA